MKASSVFQGLKSLAAQLHPQLPLTLKESHRLLEAVTTSFRDHLDEVHPRNADARSRKPVSRRGDSTNPTGQAQHVSSVAYTDNHLASVLTNPLLVKSDKAAGKAFSYATAKAQLRAYPEKDPMVLFEEYDGKQAATVPIAILCLEAIRDIVQKLPQQARHDAIAQYQAGRRLLQWIWRTQPSASIQFERHHRLINLAVPLLVYEGNERYVWEWMFWISGPNISTSLESTGKLPTVPVAKINRKSIARSVSEGKDATDTELNWGLRSYVLRRLIQSQLEPKDRSADTALESFFKAMNICEAAKDQNDPFTIPLGPAAILLSNAFARNQTSYANTTSRRFERFIASADIWCNEQTRFSQYQKSFLWLSHPRNPTAQPALRMLQQILAPEVDDKSKHLATWFLMPREEEAATPLFRFLLRTAARLNIDGYREEAYWTMSQAEKYFPMLTTHIGKHMKQFDVDKRAATATKNADHFTSERLPFPAFG